MSVLAPGTISDTFADEQSECRSDTEDEARERTQKDADDVIKWVCLCMWDFSFCVIWDIEICILD